MASPSGLSIPTPVVVDASIWVAFFLTADVNYEASSNWIDNHTSAGGMVVGPSIVLTEVASAISRRLARPQSAIHAARAISRLAPMRIIQMDSTLIWEATDISARFGLRGADSIYVATAQQLNLPLLTWDKEQLARPASIITTMHP
jgi:predicted nucleic acid-binding protein